MKVWAKTEEFSEGKFLVVRRDGTVPHWPHFVLGARDPIVPEVLRYYAQLAAERFGDGEYADSIRELAGDFEAYREEHGEGDPPSGPHRVDDEAVIVAMRNPGCEIDIESVTVMDKGSFGPPDFSQARSTAIDSMNAMMDSVKGMRDGYVDSKLRALALRAARSHDKRHYVPTMEPRSMMNVIYDAAIVLQFLKGDSEASGEIVIEREKAGEQKDQLIG